MRVCIAHGREDVPIELIYLLLGIGIDAESLPFVPELVRKIRTDTPDETIVVLTRVRRQDLAIIEAMDGHCGYVMATEVSDKDRVGLLAVGVKHVFDYPQELRQFAVIFKERSERQRLLMTRAMSEVFRCGPVHFLPADRMLIQASGNGLKLTAGETRLLVLLVLNANRVLSRSAIHKGLGRGPIGVDSRAVDVVASSIRRKLSKIETPTDLVSVRAEGYRLDGSWVRASPEAYTLKVTDAQLE